MEENKILSEIEKRELHSRKALAFTEQDKKFYQLFLDLGETPENARKKADDFVSLKRILQSGSLSPVEQKRLDEYNEQLKNVKQ